jgi:adenylate kinase
MESVLTIACDENVKPGGKESKLAPQFLTLRDVDKEVEIGKGGYAQYGVYLSQTDQDEQEEEWSKVCGRIINEIESLDPKNAFLLAHGVYFRNKAFRSIIDLDLIRKFRPTIILTLIDDAYDVVARITKKEQAEGTGSSCSFAEAIEWRTVETMLADLISRNLFLPKEFTNYVFGKNPRPEFEELANRLETVTGERIPNFVVARKHPPNTAYRLLFERWRLVTYASYPISSTRQDDKAVEQINAFRSELQANLTMYDPVTIDEYPITRADPPVIKRWPIDVVISNPNGIAQMSYDKFKELDQDILTNIESRDFRLVDQSDCLVAYRPFYGARESPAGGVDREMSQSLNGGKPIFVVHDEKVDGKLTASRLLFKPMGKATAVKPTTKELLQQVMGMQQTKTERWKREGIASTWE